MGLYRSLAARLREFDYQLEPTGYNWLTLLKHRDRIVPSRCTSCAMERQGSEGQFCKQVL